MTNRKPRTSPFGTVRWRQSRAVGAGKRTGAWQARYTGPDGVRYSAPTTFTTKGDATTWLAVQAAAISKGTWLPPNQIVAGPMTLGEYTELWLAERDLEARTRDHYAQLLRDHIEPTFGDVPLTGITAAAVTTWHARLAETTGPTARAHAYGLLRTILRQAERHELITRNPCQIEGAGTTRRARKIRPATLPELEAVVAALPQKYRPMALLAAWCALRFGELAELRKGDVDLKAGTLTISRGVVRTKDSTRLVKGPKTEAGRRTVAIPPHLTPVLRDHLDGIKRKDGLLFPSASDPTVQLAHSSLNKVWLRAREQAGRPDLAFHDLRHTGAVLAAATGATLAELMARLGHSTPSAAMRYQHASADRDKAIAAALSAMVQEQQGP